MKEFPGASIEGLLHVEEYEEGVDVLFFGELLDGCRRRMFSAMKPSGTKPVWSRETNWRTASFMRRVRMRMRIL